MNATDERIDALNDKVFAKLRRDIHDHTDMIGPEARDAILAVIREEGLVEVWKNLPDAAVYLGSDGFYVNVWLSGNSLGFDDQLFQEPPSIPE